MQSGYVPLTDIPAEDHAYKGEEDDEDGSYSSAGLSMNDCAFSVQNTNSTSKPNYCSYFLQAEVGLICKTSWLAVATPSFARSRFACYIFVIFPHFSGDGREEVTDGELFFFFLRETGRRGLFNF